MMFKLQKAGGIAALIEAATFLIGFGFFFTLLIPAGFFDAAVDPLQKVIFLADNSSVMYLFYFIIYVIFGIFLVVHSLALYERLKSGSSALAQTATVFGLIWAGLVIASGMVANIGTGVVVDLFTQDPSQAVTVWLSVNTVVTGLGGGNEIVGGLWILLISLAALRAGGLPKVLNYFGVVIGGAGLLTTIPIFGELGIVFGLGTIVWFIWVGIVMLRQDTASQ